MMGMCLEYPCHFSLEMYFAHAEHDLAASQQIIIQNALSYPRLITRPISTALRKSLPLIQAAVAGQTRGSASGRFDWWLTNVSSGN
jgi:hypothetical protein